MGLVANLRGPRGPQGPPGPGTFPYIDARSYVVADGVTDNLAALNRLINDAKLARPDGSIGNCILFPPGKIGLSDQWLIQDSYMRFVCANDNSTIFQALPSFPTTPGKAVIQVGPHPSGNGDINGVSFENLRVHGGARADVGIGINDGNEHCAIRNVEVRQVNSKGLYVTQTNALLVERFGSECSATGTASCGIHLDHNTGMIQMRMLSNLTSGHTSTPAGTAGVIIDNTPLTVISCGHAEWFTYGVWARKGSGTVVVQGWLGHSTVAGANRVFVDPGYGAPTAVTVTGLS